MSESDVKVGTVVECPAVFFGEQWAIQEFPDDWDSKFIKGEVTRVYKYCGILRVRVMFDDGDENTYDEDVIKEFLKPAEQMEGKFEK